MNDQSCDRCASREKCGRLAQVVGDRADDSPVDLIDVMDELGAKCKDFK